jgi:hypothetical protein
MSLTLAIMIQLSALAMESSKSVAKRRLRLIQADVPPRSGAAEPGSRQRWRHV